MPLRAIHTPIVESVKPGTCNQTGNNAPKFRWPAITRIIIHEIAHHLGATDEEMAVNRKWPDSAELYSIFVRLLPWFPNHYNETQNRNAIRNNYAGPLIPFCAAKVHNRLHYLFTKSGSKTSNRQYGPSSENPNNLKGIRRGIRDKYSEKVRDKIIKVRTITEIEVKEWSK